MKKLLSVLLCAVLLVSTLLVGTANAGEVNETIEASPKKYRVRLLLREIDYFTPGMKAFGGDDSKNYVNYGASHIAADEDWARIDYRDTNGTGEIKSEYITLHDKDGDGRFNVVSSWGSSGGYFPSKDGILIDGFPVYLYAQYLKKENEFLHGNGQFGMYLQVAVYQNGEWVWPQGTNTNIGSATSNSFDSSAMNTYGGGIAYLVSNSPDGKNVVMSGEVAVEESKYPQAQGANPTISYSGDSKVSCPKPNEANLEKTIQVTNMPVDQYGISMAAFIKTEGDAESGITQNGWKTVITSEANLPGGDYNTEACNSQIVKTKVTWPQVPEGERSAEASFTLIDSKYAVSWKNSDNTLYYQDEYYYGFTPTVAVPAKPMSDDGHYLQGTWSPAVETVSENSPDSYVASYTFTPHAYTSYEYVDETYHNKYCAADAGAVHFVKARHVFTEEVIAATCHSGGYTRCTCEQCGYYYDKNQTNPLPHDWDTGVKTKEPTCFENGTILYTCSRCNDTYTKPISQLEHRIELVTVPPTDSANGTAYYTCQNCGSCWAALFNSETGDYDIPDETPLTSPQQAIALSGNNLPAPAFNTFVDQSIGYNYFTRGASLKYVFGNTFPVEQPLRFTASVKVPEGVNYQIGESGNAVVDAGFVYSQKDYIENDISRMVVSSGDRYIAQMSIADKNGHNGVFTGHNWGGITLHQEEDGDYLTFNIVINVRQKNWTKDYVVRPYLIYNIAGTQVLVYDREMSARSVLQVANSVKDNAKETSAARQYCQAIVDSVATK